MSRRQTKDSILIEDLMLYARIGCTEEERAFPQRLLLSASLGLDVSKAAETNSLDATVCFSRLAALYEKIASERSWTLLEELADHLIRKTFDSFETAQEIRLKIKKFAVPNTAWVGLELHRERS